MALPRPKTRLTSVFSRNEIGVEQLQSLKEKFADGNLTEKEFVSLFREIIDASLSETKLSELFQKIDANSDGTVDWDELTNYMFLSGSSSSDEYRGEEESSCYETAHPERHLGGNGSGIGSTGVSLLTDTMGNVTGTSGQALSLGLLPHHKDIITRIVRLERPSVYLTTSKDGSVRTWSTYSLLPQQVLASGRDWLTDCCLMKQSNRLAMSSMDRTLSFFDLKSGQLIGELVDYSQRYCIPLCLAYVQKPSDDREAIAVGDDRGGLSILTCSDQWLMCDGRSLPPGQSVPTDNSSPNPRNGTRGVAPATSRSSGPVPLSTASGSGSTSRTAAATSAKAPSNFRGEGGKPARSTMLEAQGFTSRVHFQKHTDWVTRVKWVNDLRALVATSLDKTVSILDIDRLVVKFEYTQHRKGVFDLVWCATTRLIASCGMEREIHIWNPYSSQRAVATLEGHTSSVMHLESDNDRFQIVSAAADNTVKVWDVRTYRCLQTFDARGGHATTCAGTTATPAAVSSRVSGGRNVNRVSALLFDGSLLTGTTQLTRWTVKPGFDTLGADGVGKQFGASLSTARMRKLRTDALAELPVQLACYNTVFHQVVTATLDAESVIKTWSAETGDEIFSFAHAHGSDPVTSIAFDHAGRRLLTGSHDGEQLKMWNFSNGALVKQFRKNAVSSLLNVVTPATAGTVARTAPRPADPVGGSREPAAIGNVPWKRKPRDVMLLPASFDTDCEGKHGSAAVRAQSKLPSPTCMRLERGQDQPTPVWSLKPRLRPQFDGTRALSPTRARGTRGLSARDQTPRSARGATSRYRRHEVTGIIDIERNIRVGAGASLCQRFVCCVGWDRQLFVWADTHNESEALPLHQLPPDSAEENEFDASKLGRGGRRGGSRQHHTMDIRALAYVPPAYVATAGLDGMVLLWSLTTGEFVAPFHQNTGPIEALWYADRLQLLFAAGERGILFCFDRSMVTQGEISLNEVSQTSKPAANFEPITVLRCDTANTHLISGDAAGCIQVWELCIARNHEGMELALVCTWRLGDVSMKSANAPSCRVLCADIVENFTRGPELFGLFSCANGEVSLWTLDGVKVGSFGRQHRTWQLGKPATYAFSESCCYEESLPMSGIPVDTVPVTREKVDTLDNPAELPLAAALQPVSSVFIKNCAIDALNNTPLEPRKHLLLQDTMPKLGDVWMSVSCPCSRSLALKTSPKQDIPEDVTSDQTCRDSLPLLTVEITAPQSEWRSPLGPSKQSKERRALANVSYLNYKLADVEGDITGLITIVKVTRGEVFYWDSAAAQPLSELMVRSIHDFVRNGDWMKHPLLSHFIGRSFLDSDMCFRVTAIVMRSVDPPSPETKRFALIDCAGNEHVFQPLNEAISSIRLKVFESSRTKKLQQKASKKQISLANAPFQNSVDKQSMHTSKQIPNVVSQADSTTGTKWLEDSASKVVPLASVAGTLPFLRSHEKELLCGLFPKRSGFGDR